MTHPFFERHRLLLREAVDAIASRAYWSAYPEMPSPKAYGEHAATEGKAAFDGYLDKPFPLEQPATARTTGDERSPYGFRLGVRYPKVEIDDVLEAAGRARKAWHVAGPATWAGVCLEILHRLNRRSVEIAHAVMHTSGQSFMMAFQAGGPHAQDRGLEAVAYAWQELQKIPPHADWEKPQGKNPPLRMRKTYTAVPRGIGLVIGCCTFPTWNGYPGLFASLATGNAVIVKPHPAAILPLAITVRVAREVLRDAGFDPNVVMLAAHEAGESMAQDLALRPEVGLIDFTGSSANGNWLEQNARHAQVYTEKSGVNQIVIDSTDDLQGMARNIAFSLALYSGQMCTAPQNVYIPLGGIDTPDGCVGFHEVAQAIGAAIDKLVADPARAVEVTGAIQNRAVLERIDAARQLGEVVADSRPVVHPAFPDACVRTPLFLKMTEVDESKIMQELFGPISLAVATDSTAHSLALAGKTARQHGALTLSLYSRKPEVIARAREVAAEGGVSLSINLTGGVYVNQSAAFSDFHGTGANPAANASLCDTAFVASRFRVVQSREHV